MARVCVTITCTRQSHRKTGECESCYRKRNRLLSGCSIKECPGGVVARGWCGKHWQRWRTHGSTDPSRIARVYGDTYITRAGYVVEYVPGHVQADEDGRTLYHRRVMSDIIGRRLESYENVHHKNGNRQDNRPNNLELWISRQPAGQRIQDLVAWAKWILETYE